MEEKKDLHPLVTPHIHDYIGNLFKKFIIIHFEQSHENCWLHFWCENSIPLAT